VSEDKAEEIISEKKKLTTLKRVVLIVLIVCVLCVVVFIAWENFNVKMYTDSTVQAQQSIQEMQRKGVSF